MKIKHRPITKNVFVGYVRNHKDLYAFLKENKCYTKFIKYTWEQHSFNDKELHEIAMLDFCKFLAGKPLIFSALTLAFSWRKTKEGHCYWNSIYLNLFPKRS